MNKLDIVRQYFRAWIDRDADAILATLTPQGTYEDPATGGPLAGNALRGYVGALWEAFPDLTFEEESIGETGPNGIAAQWIMRGTNTGSFMGLPPTNRRIETHGADFFVLADGRIDSLKGYFDGGEVPRQLGLNVTVQPRQVGPFKFGTSISVQTGRTDEPGIFSITYLEALNDEAADIVPEDSRNTLTEMLDMDGFIGATTATIGHRMVTISAWDSADSARQVMSKGTHAQAMRGFYDGSLAKYGYTSVWSKHHINPVMVRCEDCGKMTRGPEKERICACGEKLPDAAPYW